MSQNTKTTNKQNVSTVTEEELADQELIVQALPWVIAQSEDGKKCPFCGNQPQFDSKHKDGWLYDHLRVKHNNHCVIAFSRKNIKFDVVEDANDVNIYEELGVEVTEDNMAIDLLALDPAVKAKATADGSTISWQTEATYTHYKSMGMVPIMPDGSDGTSLNGAIRSREMVAMRCPPRLREQIDRVNQSKVTQGLNARKEQADLRVNGLKEKAHNVLRRKGFSSNQAANLANALTQRLEREQMQ